MSKLFEEYPDGVYMPREKWCPDGAYSEPKRKHENWPSPSEFWRAKVQALRLENKALEQRIEELEKELIHRIELVSH